MALKAAKVPMRTFPLKTSKKFHLNHEGFTLIEILVALLLVSMIFLAFPTSDTVKAHRDLQSNVESIGRSMEFAANESILRNTITRLRISLEKSPVEFTVEYGPAGNLPLPDMPEKTVKSLAEEKDEKEKLSSIDKQFTKVEEFEDLKGELSIEVTILGVASSSQKKLMTSGEANIYFYPTGEKDGALVFFSTTEEIAYLEVQPFLTGTRSTFEILDPKRVAKIEDVLQTRMDEVYKEWISK